VVKVFRQKRVRFKVDLSSVNSLTFGVLQETVNRKRLSTWYMPIIWIVCKAGLKWSSEWMERPWKGPFQMARCVMRGAHLLSIYMLDQDLDLAEAEVDYRQNDIVVAPKIIKQVNLQGAIIIGDAMHAQRYIIAQEVADGGA
jgi:hypothetical protein